MVSIASTKRKSKENGESFNIACNSMKKKKIKRGEREREKIESVIVKTIQL